MSHSLLRAAAAASAAHSPPIVHACALLQSPAHHSPSPHAPLSRPPQKPRIASLPSHRPLLHRGTACAPVRAHHHTRLHSHRHSPSLLLAAYPPPRAPHCCLPRHGCRHGCRSPHPRRAGPAAHRLLPARRCRHSLRHHHCRCRRPFGACAVPPHPHSAHALAACPPHALCHSTDHIARPAACPQLSAPAPPPPPSCPPSVGHAAPSPATAVCGLR